MDIVDGGNLHLRVKDRQKILTAIPLSRPMGEHSVFVKWTLENARRLNNLKIRDTPSPIRQDYKWPGTFTPYDHQKTTAEFLTLNNRSFCFSEQGTGKTASAIWAADYLMSIGDIKRVLIVCPVSVMYSAWLNDLFSLVMHRTAAVAHGSKKKREAILEGDHEFVIINYDGIPITESLLVNKFDLIIADECNFVKTTSTRRWKAFNRILNPATKLWMMTGTPAAQSPVDAFGLAKLVNPNRVPRYFGAWRDKVMIKMSQFVWSPHPNATTLVGEALQPAIRFTKEACLDLPELTYQTREVELTPQQIKYYKEIKSQQLTMAAGELITAVHAAAGLTKLLQISCGAVYSDSGKVVEFDASSRLTEMVSAIREASHKTIVFVPFRHAIEIVSAKLKAEGISSEVINGAVSAGKRATIFNRFQKKTDPHVLVIQPQSAAHGVTLTAANTIIWFGPIASVETWLQANERINRPSQLNKMTVIKLTGSPVEKKVYRALEAKELAHKQLTSLYEDELNDN